MLLFLLDYLHIFGFKIPAAFSYSSTRMLLAAITSLMITVFFGPFFIKKLYFLKIGQAIRSSKECPVLANLHRKKKNTPTMGGVLVLFAMLLSLVLWMDLNNVFTWIMLFITVLLGALGIVDDFLKIKYKSSQGMKGKIKFLVQIIVASGLAFYLLADEKTQNKICLKAPVAKEQIVKSYKYKSRQDLQVLSSQEYSQRIYVPFYKEPINIGLFLAFLLIVLTVVGSSNAVNLTDGLDGLASGCLILVAAVLALFAFVSNNIEISRYLNILYIEEIGEIGVYLFALCGAVLGFLWYNGYPAQVFMGDTGSLALGGIVGAGAVLLKRELLLALVGGIFVAEALSVILQVAVFKWKKQRVFLCSPLHHHFEYKGWAESKVVLRFWIIGLLLALIGIVSVKIQ